MTTQVAVANLDGIAVASDTLVSFGQKSIDGAHKIYELGHGHNVLLLHSGRSDISGTSQYLHIVEWAKTIPVPLPKLEDYVNSYLKWSASPNPLVTDQGQKQAIISLLHNHYFWMRDTPMIRRIREKENEGVDFDGPEMLEVTAAVVAEGREHLESLKDYDGTSLSDATGWFGRFEIDVDQMVEAIFEGYPLSDESKDDLKRQSSLMLTKNQYLDADSEVAFVGYGAEEPYPGVVRMRHRGVFDGHVQATVQPNISVGDKRGNSTVHYFAQSNAMRMMVQGYHDAILRHLRDSMGDTLAERFPDSDRDSIMEILDAAFEKTEQFSREEFILPYLNTVEAMGVEKLADLADQFIALQMMSTHGDNERPTVGGFIEVAMIDREHGVRWVRKLSERVSITSR